MPFITLEELIKQLTDEYVQKQRTPVMLDEFMSEGWRTRIPRNDDDDEDHSPIIIEFWGRIYAVTDSDYDKETPYSSQNKKNLSAFLRTLLSLIKIRVAFAFSCSYQYSQQ